MLQHLKIAEAMTDTNKLIAHKRAQDSTIRRYGTMAGIWAENHYKKMYLAHLLNLKRL